MGKKLKSMFLALGWPIALLVSVLLYFTWPKSLDPNDLSEWMLIKHYRGPLDSKLHDFITTVYAYYRESQGFFDSDGIGQNRIDVRELDGTPVSTFVWPSDDDYAAGWCEIRDVNGDGRKEFLLHGGPSLVRVVAFGEKDLEYQPDRYELDSARAEIKTVSLDKDETVEFIIEDWFPDTRLATEWILVPRVKHWDPKSGFTDVSQDFPDYYRNTVIPELERKGRNDEDKKQLYLQAVREITQEILGGKPAERR